MALSNAEKQRKFRENHLGNAGDKGRLQFIVSRKTLTRLDELQSLLRKSKNALIETIIEEALLWYRDPSPKLVKTDSSSDKAQAVSSKKEKKPTDRRQDGWLQHN